MTPAVTASALIRFAIVESSISTRIGHAPQEKTDSAWHVLNGIHERPIDFHFNWRWFWPPDRGGAHHYYRSRCRRFGSFFVQGDERLVKDIRDVEIVIR